MSLGLGRLEQSLADLENHDNTAHAQTMANLSNIETMVKVMASKLEQTNETLDATANKLTSVSEENKKLRDILKMLYFDYDGVYYKGDDYDVYDSASSDYYTKMVIWKDFPEIKALNFVEETCKEMYN